MMLLYMDEDSMDQALVRAVRARGLDVLTAREAGMVGRPDADQLAFATRLGRVICTFNVKDFWSLHGEMLSAGESHAGFILVAQQRYSVGDVMRRLLRVTAALSAADTVDRAEFLSAWEPLA
jgi:hypothetical protein